MTNPPWYDAPNSDCISWVCQGLAYDGISSTSDYYWLPGTNEHNFKNLELQWKTNHGYSMGAGNWLNIGGGTAIDSKQATLIAILAEGVTDAATLKTINDYIKGIQDINQVQSMIDCATKAQKLGEIDVYRNSIINGTVTVSDSGGVSNAISVTTTTTVTPTQPGATGENAAADYISQGFIYKGISVAIGTNDIQGLNYGIGITESIPYSIASGGIRPGNMNITNDYSLMLGYLADNVSYFYTHPIGMGTAVNTYGNQTYYPVDPLVLDLNGDGVKLTDYASNPVLFDADHDGKQEQTGWVSSGDGILVVDRNANGKIDDMSETLSEYYGGQAGTNGNSGTKPYKNGFDALKSLDSNHDGIFNASDAAWSTVKVWVDSNHDGKSWNDANNNGVIDAGEGSELRTLSELGITAINLTSQTQSGKVLDGNEVLASGTFLQNGVTKEAIAANFLANPNGSTAVASGSGFIISTENGQTAVSTYVAGDAGETVDVVAKGVTNAVGGSGNDVLRGDSQNNMLVGGQGSDTFYGGDGNDILIIDGDDKQENIHAGAGKDIVQVVGDKGVTINLAQAEVEIAQGGRGNDVIIGGGTSSVFIDGQDGDDILIGGAANDAIAGGDGKDYIDGGYGNDVLRGQRGRDTIYGGGGDDYIDGGDEDDSLYGGSGNDVIKGASGDDYIDGGDGTDVVEYTGSYSEYRIMRTEKGVFISDTVAGRDGTDFVQNVEKINFKDISLLDLPSGTKPGLEGAMPVSDVLKLDKNGVAFDRSAAHLIAKEQLLTNDIDWQSDSLHITGLYDVQGGTAALTQAGDVLFTPDPKFTGFMAFKYTIADSKGNATSVTQTSTGASAPMRAAVYLKTSDLPSDPLLVNQWYLSETNILPVWKEYTGKGVHIGQFEPGGAFSTTKEVLDYRHADLKDNIDPEWLTNATTGQMAGEGAEERFSDHATMVAGVMVAAKNGEGVVGVAYDATVAGYWLPKDDVQGIAAGLARMKWYDVVNNSWGVSSNFSLTTSPAGSQAKEYLAAVQKGRNGLGTVIVSSAGNDRAKGGNTNYNYNSNNRLEITVGAINATTDLGMLQVEEQPFSSQGANILVSAPGSNIESTSRMIQADNGSIFGADTTNAQGTSFAAPIVSGIVALMLEANPNLGYRDVQEILALSAKKVSDANTTWTTNGATNWNGGGMHFSHDYGFGEVDARAAVHLAETWMSQQTAYNEKSLAVQPSSGVINLTIPDGNSTGVTSSLTVTENDIQIEHVEVHVKLTHAKPGDLILKLISPDGTESILVNRPGKDPNNANATGDSSFNGLTTLDYVLTTAKDWGELSAGNWKLQVIDTKTGSVGTLNSWSINIFGKTYTTDDQYVYTDEYAALATTAGRNTLQDTNGGFDIINAAALSSASQINLSTGSAVIAGKTLTINGAGAIEAAIGGAFNDTIVGNAADNLLAGGRGNDLLSGAAGSDILFGGKGNDTLTGGAAGDEFVIEKDAGGSDVITDFTVGVDKIVLAGFSGSAYSALTFTQEGTNTRIGLGNGQSVLLQNIAASNLNANNFISVADDVSLDNLLNFKNHGFGTDNSDADSVAPDTGAVAWGGDGDDRIFGGTGSDLIYGGAGNDVLCGENSSSAAVGSKDLLFGEAGNDDIYGGAGDDILSGGDGLDYISGNAGNDTILLEGDEAIGTNNTTNYIAANINISGTVQWNANPSGTTPMAQGGSGNDIFKVVEDAASTASQGIAKNLIVDFEVSNTNEKIDLSEMSTVTSFSDLNFSTVTFNDGSGTQLITRVWLGPVAVGTQYISLYNVQASQLSAANFIFADAGDYQKKSHPLLQGTSSNDTLIGDAGGQTLDGGLGADTMEGRTGDDTYIVDNAGDVVKEVAGGGYDTVKASVNYTLPGEVEALTLTGTANSNGTGNAVANRITGNSGNNVLNGGGGSDTLIGGAGNDTYVVDDGSDRVLENPGEGTDTVQSSVSFTLAGNLENLTLTGTGAINGTGNALNNILTGNAADNKLDGAQGADTMAGGAGSDVYLVDNAGDVVTENANAGIDTVYATLNYTLGANVENLILGNAAVSGTGNELANEITGNAANNILTGGAGNDWLDGGTGADQLRGGTGDDTYVVDNAGDAVTENASEGNDTVLSSITYTLGTNVENLALTGTTNINGTGNTLDNILIGNSGNNALSGGAGKDILDGGNGADTMAGGAGDDIYVVDNTSDGVNENAGEGTDTVQSSISYTLGSNLENLTLTGTAAINGTGNTLNNIITGNGANNVLNGGTGADTMVGGAGNDTYVVDNAGDIVTENAGAGTDMVQSFITYTLGANLENLTLTGTAAINGTGNTLNNVLAGNGANNVLTGGAGNDTLNGGAGADTMAGGTGNDIYVVDNAGDKVTENAGEGTDTVQSAITYTLGSNLENLTLIGTAAINGTGNTLDNVLTGNGANNVLTGGAGNDTLNGGAGADTMAGGAGNDIYIVDNAGDIVTENAGEGTDTVQSAITYTLGSNLENLTLIGTAAINGTGNTLDNVLTGNGANNVLTGGAGNDTLNGGAGADTLVGGAGNDTYVVDNAGDKVTENAGEGTDTVQSSITYTLGSNLENLTLIGTAAINGTGNTLDNVLAGNGVNNVLTGGAGNDTLNGGAGADTLVGGTGNDTYVIDNIGDVVTENAGEGTDTVQSWITYILGANVENLMLAGTAAINGTGNTLNNTITGNSANNVLNGGTGADTMAGGAGNDTYIVDNAGDIVTENAGAGTDMVQSSITYTLGANLENLTLIGTAAINGTGNTLDNVLAGNGANNVLTGGAGNDTLNGGAGADTMVGGAGNDTYVVDNAGDIVTENAGEGTDTVQSSITYTLGSNFENLTLTGTAAINGTGNTLNNIITGNSANNTLSGGAGNDTLTGGAGSDTYLFGSGAGNDTINDYDTSGGTDILQFQNLVMASIAFTRNGNDLVCTIAQTGETARVSNWTLGTSYQVDQFKFSDGTLTAAQVSQKIA
ncbi:proprotein convertase P-domain-containing protein [Sporomusa ovata]|uniref:proprotein convertase P-domain-containing protein n=2 Tax=Sporomusa ovata TaxID=2378 RepID=UPI000686083F